MKIFLSERRDRVAPGTLAAYEAALIRFFSSLSTPPEQASAEELSGYLLDLCRTACRPTVARALTALRGYYGSLCRRGAREDDPTAALSLKSLSPQRKPSADDEDFAALMNTPFQGIRGRRDRVMLLLLRETGVSVSELVRLRRGDVSPASHCLTVAGKKTALSAALSRCLAEYVSVTALVSDSDASPLFINEAGQGISRQGFWKNVKARARAAGLPEEYTLQCFRREKNR